MASGFDDVTTNIDDNFKLVPWLNWDEWDFVRLSLFSSSPNSVAKALRRIATWRSRGCLPVSIEVTASFVEIQQRDHHFSGCLSNGALDSEEMLSMLYTMAIMRLVNGIIEKTRERQKLSIAVAANLIDMPRMLIDIRHEGSHRELPSLHLLRRASIQALDWLKSYYWDRQKSEIPYQTARSANVRKEIRSRLRELAFCLKLKHEDMGKRSKHHEQLIGASGRHKLLSLVACKFKSPKNVGSKKQMMKASKKLARLYSFFSSDVVTVLLEFLLKPSNSIHSMDSLENFKIRPSLQAAQDAFDEWKPVIAKFSKLEPDVLLSLLGAVLDMIETRKISRDNFGSENFSISNYDLETEVITVLSSLFTWLVLVLKALNLSLDESQGSHSETDCHIPKTTLIELVRRCLHIADPENHELLGSALLIAKMAENTHLKERIQKLSLLTSLYSKHHEDSPPDGITEELSNQDKYIHQAAQKLLKLRKFGKSNIKKVEDPNDGNIWTVAESWKACPIGMLPRAVGISGYLPCLDLNVNYEAKTDLSSMEKKEISRPEQSNKSGADCAIETTEESSSSIKKMRVAEESDLPLQVDTNVVSTFIGVKGRLLIDGFYQEVGDEESKNILSRLRVLVPTKS